MSSTQQPKMKPFYGDGLEGMGFLHFWGYTPATDLLSSSPQKKCCSQMAEVNQEIEDKEEEERPLRVFVSGGADLRHVLLTAARIHDKEGKAKREIEFFIHENDPETLARQLLFLEIVCNTEIPSRERADIYLECLGNTLLRERVACYMSDRVNELTDLVCEEGEGRLREIVNVSLLKQKDKDRITDAFARWTLKAPSFDVEQLRDQRCRGAYGVRFDHRVNLFDWDYTSNLKAAAPTIHWLQYKQFRLSGVAFDSPLGTYTHPNKSLQSYVQGSHKTDRTKIMVRGYWGDLIVSPYISFGVDCCTDSESDRKRLFKVVNTQQRHHAEEISRFNVFALLSEIETGQAARLPEETEAEQTYPFKSPLEEVFPASSEEKSKGAPSSSTDDAKKKEESLPKIVEISEEEEEEEKDKEAAVASGAENIGSNDKQKEGTPEKPPLPLLLRENTFRLFPLVGDMSSCLDRCKSRLSASNIGIEEDEEEEEEKDDPLFDAVFLAALNSSCFLKPEEETEEEGKKNGSSALLQSLRPGASLFAETLKFHSQLNGASRLRFREKLYEAATRHGMEVQGNVRKSVFPLEGKPAPCAENALKKQTECALAEASAPPILCFRKPSKSADLKEGLVEDSPERGIVQN
uniref:DUF4470 domain-containing protein n=1 Tax=Chromera velia CCMP2878 TaxID=1169474 RepID=A0A0G4FFD7_9ALVE|eukprot:Cvel_16698.t1-p1 / transcript=Cvel_16698.t1 / gene=Cvel_16698 / organism=Chromera_velia_CCMP2878 / gene_product=Dynein assembly factor 3, axonemal, putative / transcript_product=Dynein assembly factor 3, axonemal, putative / location=Cvel_scaffold1297:3335-8501(+) / protein_length=633 / sequence_SO=supercontig / SO=protein_coding / is_pseudo=false